LGEKRRALSILDDVAARPGYSTLTLEESDALKQKAALMPEHSNIAGVSLKSLQLAAGRDARGRKRPDSHYIRLGQGDQAAFADTAEFLSEEYIVPAVAPNATSAADKTTEGGEVVATQITASLLKWIPLTSGVGVDGDSSSSPDASFPGQSVADRLAIEEQEDELGRRHKLRHWKDVQRFDPAKADQEEREQKQKEKEKQQGEEGDQTQTKSKDTASAKSAASKNAAASSKLAKYTPQLAFNNTAPDRASASAAPAPLAATIERDGDKLYEIRAPRLRDFFTKPAAPVSFSSSSAPAEASTAAMPAPVQPFKFGFDSAPSPAPVQPFKFGFSSSSSEPAEEEPEPEDDEAEAEQTKPAASPSLRSAAAASSASKAAAASPAVPAAATAIPARAVPTPTAASAAASAALSAASAAAVSKALQMRQQQALATATALRASNVVKQLSGQKRPASALSAAASAAAAAAAARKKPSAADSSDDSDDDGGDGGFMRSAGASEDALAEAWLSARAARTHDFQSKNKSAVRRSSGTNASGSAAASTGGLGGAGGLQRAATEQARAVLELSEGRAGSKRARH
jgi:hypothetical protein